ncbi:MAG: flagellar FliJ family protein [Janthinobacterium lividum]
MKKPDSLRIVLSVRLRAEENEERALGSACAEVFRAEAALDALVQACRRAEAAQAGVAGELLHGTDLQTRELHLRALRHAQDAAHANLAAAQSAKAKQQAAYLEARRGREVLETLLKQRARAQYTAQEKRDTSRAEDQFLGRRAAASSASSDQV